MIDVAWNIEEDDHDSELTGTPRPLLGTWHYLRNALRREWRVWAGLSVLGAVLGLAVAVLLPPSSTGTVTILMAHPANLDAASAMGTDVSLLNTREVALRTVRKLGLTQSPDSFQSRISAQPVTTEILTVAVKGPDDRTAVTWAGALTTQYLDFRATQLRSLSSGLISGLKARIGGLQDQVNSLNREYSRVSEQGVAGQNRASEILARRTGLNGQINDTQQAIEDATLQTEAAISSTHVVDNARAIGHSAKRSMVLAVGSGLIGGAALGVGFVLFRALTSEQLRRRLDVALALGAPVRFSVTTSGPPERRLGGLAHRGRAWTGRDLETLVHGLESAVLPHTGTPGSPKPRVSKGTRKGPPSGVALAAIGNPRTAALVIGAVATHLRGLGLSVFLADLSASGALATHMGEPGVFRPTGVPGLARGPRGAAPGAVTELPVDDARRDEWDAADVVLALVEVNPGIDVENLRSWVDQVIPLVTAGRCTAELLETTAELIRAAGLDLPFAMMVGSDDTDRSLGVVSSAGVEHPSASQR